jgi:hypothetical protein
MGARDRDDRRDIRIEFSGAERTEGTKILSAVPNWIESYGLPSWLVRYPRYSVFSRRSWFESRASAGRTADPQQQG